MMHANNSGEKCVESVGAKTVGKCTACMQCADMQCIKVTRGFDAYAQEACNLTTYIR
jgi:hypothetical protein